MLREGKPISHNDSSSCDQQCAAATWSGARAPNQMWSSCLAKSPDEFALYHACGNPNGLNFRVAEGGNCEWGSSGDSGLELWIDSAPSACPTGMSNVRTRNDGSFCIDTDIHEPAQCSESDARAWQSVSDACSARGTQLCSRESYQQAYASAAYDLQGQKYGYSSSRSGCEIGKHWLVQGPVAVQ
eukprot:gene56928-biopygen80153